MYQVYRDPSDLNPATEFLTYNKSVRGNENEAVGGTKIDRQSLLVTQKGDELTFGVKYLHNIEIGIGNVEKSAPVNSYTFWPHELADT